MAVSLQKTYSNDLTTALAGKIWEKVKEINSEEGDENAKPDPKVKKAEQEWRKDDPRDIPVTTDKDFRDIVLKYFGDVELDVIRLNNRVSTLSNKITAYGGGIADTQKLIINQNELLEGKLDLLLESITNKNKLLEEQREREKFQQLELDLEQGKDTSTTKSLVALSKSKKGGFLWKLLFNRKVQRHLSRTILRKVLRRPRIYAKLAKRRLARTVVGRTLKTASNFIPNRQIGKNLMLRALSSRVVQEALVRKLGKEGAEKLTLKLAGKAVPGANTVYGAVEGLVRGAMGDWKGMMLSFGSAVPYAGYAFSAIDLMRDIDPEAYTTHIEGKFPPSDEDIGNFFRDALGVTPDQYETGTPIQPHVKSETDMINPIGTALISSSIALASAAGVEAEVKNEVKKLGLGYSIVNMNLPTDIGRVTKIARMPSIVSEEKVLSEKPVFDTMTTSEARIPKHLEEETTGGGGPKVTPRETWSGEIQDSDVDKILPQGNPLPTSGYGPRPPVEGVATASRDHKGVDYGVDAGSPVLAAEGGVVEQVLSNFTHGQAVTVRHADGTANRYGHVDSLVSEGDKVVAGQKIATVKYWERIYNGEPSDNTHLHFERFPAGAELTWGNQINPTEYLKNLDEKKSVDFKPEGGGVNNVLDSPPDIDSKRNIFSPLQDLIPSLLQQFSSSNEDIEDEVSNPQPVVVVMRNNYNRPTGFPVNIPDNKLSHDDFLEKYKMGSLI